MNVFILRPDNLGDIVLFSGILRHIRSLYPTASITLIVKQSYLNLIEICPHIDRVMEWEKISSLPYDWLPELRGKYRFNWFIRHFINKKYKTDIILLPVRSPTGGLFGMHDIVASIPAAEKIGLTGDYCNQTVEEDQAADKIYSKRMSIKDNQQRTFELEINNNFLKFLGLKLDILEIWPEFWTDEEDHEWACRSIPLHPNTITLAICPGVTSNLLKFYPGENFVHAISELRDTQISVIIFGSPTEMEMCLEVENALTACKNVNFLVNLAGQSTIRQMIEGLKRCDLILSQDTAALHIAVALKKPTVGIMGGGHYGRFYPWGDERINRVANKFLNCYGCNWRCIYPTTRCIQEIPPMVVSEQIIFALQGANLN